MLTLYIVSAAVAGGLLLLSLIGADHGMGHDAHFDHGGHDTGHDGDHDHGNAPWLPFLSLRFYTYFFAGFGATGLLIQLLTKTPAMVGFWLSLGVGMVGGLGGSIMVRILRLGETTSSSKEHDILGLEAQVLVPIRGTSPGRIRCIVRGEAIDYLAVCDDPTPIAAGSIVIVVAIENGRPLVMPRAALYSDDVPHVRTT